MKRCLLIFVRKPVCGSVKTRLAAGLGDETVCGLYRAFVEDILQTMDGLEGVDLIVCYSPAEAGTGVRRWLGRDRRYFPQRGADLGERMFNALEEAFSLGYEQVALMGSDVPQVRVEHLHEAFGLLDREPSVVCPAEDGGYWLIGFGGRVVCRKAFTNMAWSTGGVLAETLRRLQECGGAAVGPGLIDVDDQKDLEQVVASGALPEDSRTLVLARKALSQ